MIDLVKLEFARSPRGWSNGRKLMLEAGRMFRYLSRSYMERLLAIFLDRNAAPQFVMLGVGTRADQDDIDLGIIYRESEYSDAFSRAVARLSTEMLKKATRLHFHLSEHVGQHSLAATIEDYEEILDRGMYDFVIVAEMLGAAPIMGDQSLFEEFKTRVTDRFYYGGKDNRYHEGYLRGILGEINSLLTRPKLPEIIYPKDDGLRPIKSLLSALKLVYGARKVIAWNIVDDLKQKNPDRIEQYADLEQALSFFEILRHLYQITVAQDEEIPLDQPGIESMAARIAEIIGFENKGVVKAKDFMLVNYYEFLDSCARAIGILAGDLRKHLLEISVFKPIFSLDSQFKVGYEGNLAYDFIKRTKFFKGITYWDDFLEQLGDETKIFYDEFIKSFLELPPKLRNVIAHAYLSGVKYDLIPSVRFIHTIGKRARSDDGKTVFKILSDALINEMEKLAGPSNALTRTVSIHPDILNSLMAHLDWKSLERLSLMASASPSLPELVPHYQQLRTLCEIHCRSSQFFKRHFRQILDKYPLYIKNLHRNDKLKEITNGFYSDLNTPPTIAERIDLLGDYYDLEFVRVGLLAMSGASCEITDSEFTEFCDNYAQSLYDFCQREVHLSLGYSMHTRDLFALYATGGHAREQGFDDDYDMIVILDSDDKDQIDYSNKIVGKMNSEILKRGILPHHRFADHFSSYVISFKQLAGYLDGGGENIFIDKAQILSSRMLVGSGRLEDKLQQEIITPFIFAEGGRFINRMKTEVKSRHAAIDEEKCSDIKECCGGLRDIEMLLLMYQTKNREREPLSRKFLQKLIEIEPRKAGEFKIIKDHLNFIKSLRDLYRLKVAAHNVIDPRYLAPVAECMGYGSDEKAAAGLFSDFQERTKKAGKVIQKLIDEIDV
jgi:hypothetical protein